MSSKTFQFNIILNNSNPLIWRRFKVTDDYRMDRFHQVLQIVMGWTNSHLHEFEMAEDETKLRLRDFNLEEKEQFTYLYDFGDSWEHSLSLEQISREELLHPKCLAGENACPPEDCGGVWGYEDMLEILKNKTNPEYEDYKEWLPIGFDPAKFSIESINQKLEVFGKWHRKHPRKKSTPWHQI